MFIVERLVRGHNTDMDVGIMFGGSINNNPSGNTGSGNQNGARNGSPSSNEDNPAQSSDDQQRIREDAYNRYVDFPFVFGVLQEGKSVS